MADTHLGYRQYGSEQRRQDFHLAFQQALEIAQGNHPEFDIAPVDAVIHSGDLFDDQRTSLDDVAECLHALQKFANAEIPFYGIVGNHENRRGVNFLDLYEKIDVVTRLSRAPQMLGDDELALYGIDATRDPDFETADFSLTPPEDDDAVRLVAMHQLFSPPMNDLPTTHDLEPVLDRFGIDIDGLALGDCHERMSARCQGVQVWYPGSTERCTRGETAPRSVELLTIDPAGDPPIDRQRLLLETRPFRSTTVSFGAGDGFGRVEAAVDELESIKDTVVFVELDGEPNTVTKQAVLRYLDEQGACEVHVDDLRTGAADLEDLPETGGDLGLEDVIDEAVADLNLDGPSRAVEALVRDDDTTNSNARDRTSDLLEDLHAEAFGGDEVSPGEARAGGE